MRILPQCGVSITALIIYGHVCIRPITGIVKDRDGELLLSKYCRGFAYHCKDLKAFFEWTEINRLTVKGGNFLNIPIRPYRVQYITANLTGVSCSFDLICLPFDHT